MNIPKYDMGYYSKHSFKRPTERNVPVSTWIQIGSGFILGPLMADFQVRTGGFRFREGVFAGKRTAAFKVTLRIVDQERCYLLIDMTLT